MFYALNSKNQLVHISNATSNCNYFCPLCYSLVKIRTDQMYACHFAHVNHNKKLDIVKQKFIMQVKNYWQVGEGK